MMSAAIIFMSFTIRYAYDVCVFIVLHTENGMYHVSLLYLYNLL